MALEIITMEDLEKFRIRLLEDLKSLIQPIQDPPKKWLRSSEIRTMLGISHGTLQNLRIKGLLPYKKIGGIMFYNYEDIVNLLENQPPKRSRKNG